jgi:perosamine synthetase
MTRKLKWPVWPRYESEHEEAVLRVIRSNQLYAANEVAAFEKDFSSYTGSKYAVGVGNATQGLHLALAALGIGSGDEVIVTPYSWISSASCVLMQNAIPVFADIEAQSFGICPDALKDVITPQTRAVVLVHMFGLASDVDAIQKICATHGISLIEDGSHSHGARLRGKHLGTFGDIGVFSLHQRKAISTGDGGVLCTDNPILYERLSKLRSFGDKQLSYNYRMTEFAAALGRVGLANLETQNRLRQQNHSVLSTVLQHPNVVVIEPRPNVEAVYYSNLIDINIPTRIQNRLLNQCAELGIPLKRTWQPLHWHPHFKRENMPKAIAPWDKTSSLFLEPENRKLANAEHYQTARLFELDCHPLVTASMVDRAAELITKIIQNEIEIST